MSGHAVCVFHLHNTAERKGIEREKTIIYTHLIGKCQRDKRGKGMGNEKWMDWTDELWEKRKKGEVVGRRYI